MEHSLTYVKKKDAIASAFQKQTRKSATPDDELQATAVRLIVQPRGLPSCNRIRRAILTRLRLRAGGAGTLARPEHDGKKAFAPALRILECETFKRALERTAGESVRAPGGRSVGVRLREP